MTQHAVESDSRPREGDPAPATAAGLVVQARAAMKAFEGADQSRVDDAVRALASRLLAPDCTLT